MDTTFNDKNSSLSTNSNSSAFWDYKKYKTFEHKKFRKYEKRNPTSKVRFCNLYFIIFVISS